MRGMPEWLKRPPVWLAVGLVLLGTGRTEGDGPRKDPRLDHILSTLAREGEASLSGDLRGAVETGLLRIDAGGAAQVYVHLLPGAGVMQTRSGLSAMGARIEREDAARRIIQARIPAPVLSRAASLPGVKRLSVPRYAVTDTGSVTTAGDTALRALRTRDEYGVDGAGVRIGVISDGINGLSEAIATGDIPPTTFVHSGQTLVLTTGGVTATSFRHDFDLEAGLTGTGSRGAEGVALLEILHDMAPGARLFFANFATDLEFSAAVDFLASRTDVLVDDISFFGGPYDGRSDVSVAAAASLANPVHPLRAIFTTAGNRAQEHYEEPYIESAQDGLPLVGAAGRLHLFQPTASTVDAGVSAPGPANQIYLQTGQSVVMFLTWDDPPGASSNDYDLHLFRNDVGEPVAASGGAQTGTQDPLEVLAFINTGRPGLFDIMVHNYLDLAEPRLLELFMIQRPFRSLFAGNGAALSFSTPSGSIPMMADAGGGVITVGAIGARDAGLDTIEEFSGRGPTNDGRMKPDLSGIDGVAVTGAGGFPASFTGTSAAAPHAAALTALLLQTAPCLMGDPGDPDAALERSILRQTLLGRAVDLGEPGPDDVFGHGRADAFDAATAALPVAVTRPLERSECTSPAGADVRLDGSASSGLLPTCGLTHRWSGPFGEADGPAPLVIVPLGEHDVLLEVSQNGVTRVSTRQTVRVADTTAPIAVTSPAPPILWPPDHRLVEVDTRPTALDLCDPEPRLALLAVSSNEPDDAPGAGDGETAGDIRDAQIGAADRLVTLRAERDARGCGRRYDLRYSATDASGNTSGAAAAVEVPRSADGATCQPLR